MSTRQIAKLLSRAKELRAFLDQRKTAYAQLDEITVALVPHEKLLMKHGVRLEDRFLGTNVAFKRVVAFQRYELIFPAVRQEPKFSYPSGKDQRREKPETKQGIFKIRRSK